MRKFHVACNFAGKAMPPMNVAKSSFVRSFIHRRWHAYYNSSYSTLFSKTTLNKWFFRGSTGLERFIYLSIGLFASSGTMGKKGQDLHHTNSELKAIIIFLWSCKHCAVMHLHQLLCLIDGAACAQFYKHSLPTTHTNTHPHTTNSPLI